VEAPDLQVAARVATGLSFAVALVEQPYRVAGRRSPPPAAHLDAAWLTVVAALRRGPLRKLPLVVGGRSSGARVACRTAKESGAAAVLCLAFPLRPPRRSGGAEPPSRQPELDGVAAPLLVVQGAGDPFGIPSPSSSRTVVVVDGNHSLRGGLPLIADAVEHWLQSLF
jgi:predicted alpha/beta-hydrolase family hydrolase